MYIYIYIYILISRFGAGLANGKVESRKMLYGPGPGPWAPVPWPRPWAPGPWAQRR